MSLEEVPNEPANKTQEVYQLIQTKVRNGFAQNYDKRTISELNKVVRDELKLSNGWTSDVREQIAKVLIEEKIAISDASLKNKLGKLKVELVKSEAEITPADPQPTQAPQPSSQTLSSPHGTLPKGWGNSETAITPRLPTQTEQQEQQSITTPKAPITPEQKEQQEKLIVKSFGFLEEVYVALGIVKGDEQEQKEIQEPKPLAKFHNDVKDFAHELNEYMIENDVRLPTYLNVLALGVSGFMIFGMPLVKFFVFSKKDKPDYDNRFDDIKVQV